MKRLLTFIANWTIILTAPIWILPVLLFASIFSWKDSGARGVFTGRESLWE